MKNTINTLLVDDEPLIIDAMQSALDCIEDNDSEKTFKVNAANNCDSALREIDKAILKDPIDLVLLDMSIPKCSESKFLSGEDIGIKIKEEFPKIKVIVLTSYNNNYRLNNIIKSLDPDGFLIKSDISFDRLVGAITSVIDDIPYYSNVILKLMRRQIKNDFTIDRIDRQMLYHISKGAKTKNLADLLPLSLSALEVRKRHIKELFGLDDNSDRQLILKAEEYGFL